MAKRHISLPKLFSSGDAKDWFQRFEVCSVANRWKAENQAVKLPTLLEGEALAIRLELNEEQRKNYETAQNKILTNIMPMGFVSFIGLSQPQGTSCLLLNT